MQADRRAAGSEMTVDGFYALAEASPDRTALVDAAGRSTTRGELLDAMNRIARGIRELGVGTGETVAVVLSNRREFVEVYGAAIQSGLYFVALNWHLKAQEIGDILHDSAAKLLVTEAAYAGIARAAAEHAGIAEGMRFAVDPSPGFAPLAALISGQSSAAPPIRSAGQIIFFTSGTTGRPKGVRKSFPGGPSQELRLTSGIGPIHRGAAAATAQGTDMVYLSSGPLYHALPLAGVLNALDRGGMVVMMDKWTPEGFLRLTEQHKVTHASLVPTMFHRLLALPEAVRATADVSSLRFVNHAGAPCPIDVKRRMIEWFGPIITEAYSSTEGAGTTVSSEEWLRKPGTVGRPSPGVEIKIYDDEGPPGVPGLVYMTPSLWDFEYLHDADKTQRARRGAMFTVGDIGYLDEDGYLFLCDRQADTIVSGGVNIYPAEIEATLAAHPAVRDVAVVGVPNEEWGEEVKAVVELHPDISPDVELAAELIDHCRNALAHFKCPRSVDFAPSLDRDPNGKLRRHVIRSRYWPDPSRRI